MLSYIIYIYYILLSYILLWLWQGYLLTVSIYCLMWFLFISLVASYILYIKLIFYDANCTDVWNMNYITLHYTHVDNCILSTEWPAHWFDVISNDQIGQSTVFVSRGWLKDGLRWDETEEEQLLTLSQSIIVW